MEKRVWTIPQAVVEKFEVTEYIASCADNEKERVYKFVCDAKDAENYALYGVFANPIAAHQFEMDESVVHYAPKDDETTFPKGWLDIDKDGVFTSGVDKEVRVWLETVPGGLSLHATTHIDMENWDIVKS